MKKYIELKLLCTEDDAKKIKDYYYLGWVLSIDIIDADGNFVDFYDDLYYRNDEKHKIFDDYIRIEKALSELLESKDQYLRFEIKREPI